MDFKILDASAFYAGVPFRSSDSWCTTPAVYEEVRHIKKSHGVLDTMIEAGMLQIREPEKDSVRRAARGARETGDWEQLSEQDVSVLALCLQVGGKIITDDFAISNAARHLDIAVIPIMTAGIRDQGVWIHYCPACRKNFRGQRRCPLCGTGLKRRLVKKR